MSSRESTWQLKKPLTRSKLIPIAARPLCDYSHAFERKQDCLSLGQGSVGWSAPVFLINRLKNLALRQKFWLKSVETWFSQGGSVREEFRSLARHLFAIYAVPGFMDSAWDLSAGPQAFQQQVAFIQLGRGAKLRSLNLPVVLTKKMEHYARRAPEHFTVLQALRYGEMRGLGGDHMQACEVAASRLGSDATNASFWRSVIRFIANSPKMPMNHISAIIDFIQSNKFAGEEVQTADGIQIRRPPWPEFEIAGRTLSSILRLVREWNPELNGNNSKGFSWEGSGTRAFRYVEKCPDEQDLDWSIIELLNSTTLYAEGRGLSHCVYTYANKCRRRESTIWSLRLRVGGEEKRMATIEVEPSNQVIVQIRAKRNRKPGCKFAHNMSRNKSSEFRNSGRNAKPRTWRVFQNFGC